MGYTPLFPVLARHSRRPWSTSVADVEMDNTIDLNNLPASSPASSADSSDSDAVNTESARVYFGPLQSPEKKLIHVINPTASRRRTLGSGPTASSLRRSARFPSPVILSPSRNDTEDNADNSDSSDNSDDAGEDVSQSRSGTPDNTFDFQQDGMLVTFPIFHVLILNIRS